MTLAPFSLPGDKAGRYETRRARLGAIYVKCNAMFGPGRGNLSSAHLFDLTNCNYRGIYPPVPYRRILNPQPSPETEIDTAEAASAAFIASIEDDLAMLTRLAQIGMEAVEAQNDYLKARLAKAAGGETPLKPGEDPGAPLNKLVQTVRRTLALKRKIAEDLDKHRGGLFAESAARRERRTDDRRRSVRGAIETALTDAFTVTYGDGDDETDEGGRPLQRNAHREGRPAQRSGRHRPMARPSGRRDGGDALRSPRHARRHLHPQGRRLADQARPQRLGTLRRNAARRGPAASGDGRLLSVTRGAVGERRYGSRCAATPGKAVRR